MEIVVFSSYALSITRKKYEKDDLRKYSFVNYPVSGQESDIPNKLKVAKYIANLGVEVVDVGVPVLSMHAPVEIVSKLDVYMAYKGFKAFLEQNI